MLDFIANHADIIIAAVQTALTLDMLPTIWTQFRARASTVPLTSSVPTAIGLAVLGLVFFSTGLYLAATTVVVGSVMWSIVAGQRIGYNRNDGSTTSASDSDPEPSSDRPWLLGADPVLHGFREDGHSCVHHAKFGWCWHRDSSTGRSQGQGVGMGLDGDSQSASTADEKISDLIYDSFAPASDSNLFGADLEEK